MLSVIGGKITTYRKLAEDALKQLKALAGGGPFNVVRYTRDESLFDRLAVRAVTPVDVSGQVMQSLLAGPRAYYLYGGTAPVR